MSASPLDLFEPQAVPERDRPHVARATGNPEWYSPAEYVEAARRVLGAVDLDPASCEVANAVIQAARIYTVHDNGLQHPWSGRVWLNPPYSARLVKAFVARLVSEYEAGSVSAAVMLVNNATETRWFQQAARAATAICYPGKRVRFYTHDGSPGAPLQGQALFLLRRPAVAELALAWQWLQWLRLAYMRRPAAVLSPHADTARRDGVSALPTGSDGQSEALRDLIERARNAVQDLRSRNRNIGCQR